MTFKPKIALLNDTHRGAKIIALRFQYNLELVKRVKKLDGARWSQSKKCWYVPFQEGCRQTISKSLSKYFVVEGSMEQFVGINRKPVNDEPVPVKEKEAGNGARPEVVVETDSKKGQMFIRFKYDEHWKSEVKKLEGAWWHTEAKVWSVYLNDTNIDKIKEIFTTENSSLIVRELIQPARPRQKQKKAIDSSIVDDKFITQLKLLNRKENTISNYKSTVAHYLHFFKGENIASIPEEKIRHYILDHRERQGYSVSHQRLMVSALKSYYRIIFKRELKSDDIPYPEKSSPLPKVISLEDVEKMIQLTVNPKHKMILIMLYGLGLRRGELANLKVNDIDFNRNSIAIFNAKGNKDRTLPIPRALLIPAKNYFRDFLPREYFLIGQNGGKYSTESILKVVKKAAERAKVQMKITPHILRHCFATHSLEKGIDLRYIQVLLGHKSTKTTEIYTHVSTKQLNKLSNPLDDIKF